jgi:hypothetical protein
MTNALQYRYLSTRYLIIGVVATGTVEAKRFIPRLERANVGVGHHHPCDLESLLAAVKDNDSIVGGYKHSAFGNIHDGGGWVTTTHGCWVWLLLSYSYSMSEGIHNGYVVQEGRALWMPVYNLQPRRLIYWQ